MYFYPLCLAAAGQCRAQNGKYDSSKSVNIHSKNRPLVESCLADLNGKVTAKWGCYHHQAGVCRCTVDSSLIVVYDEIYWQTVNRLQLLTNGYKNNEAEYWYGDMYMTYTCTRTEEDIPGDEE